MSVCFHARTELNNLTMCPYAHHKEEFINALLDRKMGQSHLRQYWDLKATIVVADSSRQLERK